MSPTLDFVFRFLYCCFAAGWLLLLWHAFRYPHKPTDEKHFDRIPGDW